MTVYYEWDCEEVSASDTAEKEKGEVIEHYHSATYKEALALSLTTPPAGSEWSIVLVRDDDDRRAWANMHDGENGTLPEWFIDGDGIDYRKVPKRFFKEVESAHKTK